MSTLNKSIRFSIIGPAHDHSEIEVETPPNSRIAFDGNGNPSAVPVLGAETTFDLLPAAAITATTDRYGVVGGSNVVIQRSDTGGVLLQTKAGPADGDKVFYASDGATALAARINAAAQHRFQAAVRIGTAAGATMFASFGLNENVTEVNPKLTAGEYAMFIYDPTGEISGSSDPDLLQNWWLATKGAAGGVASTNIKAIPGQTYDLVIQIQPSRAPFYYINGEKVGGGSPLTANKTLRVFCGAELTATPAAQADITLHFIRVNRNIG